MKRFFFLVLVLLISHTGFAQRNSNRNLESNDPKAKAILDKMKTKYHSYKMVNADYKLTVVAGDKREVQNGKIMMSGEKYRIETTKQNVMCDGNTVWIHLKERNEVQVNNARGDDLMSPAQLFRIYETGNKVIYAITGEGNEGGKSVYYIEFKPTSRAEEYSKIRLSVDKNTDLLVKAIIFNKDGNRYEFEISKITPGSYVDNSKFSFDKSQCGHCTFVDIRK